MQEQLILFETAKLAKKKGFKVEGYYLEDIEKYTEDTLNYELPTQSLLQKWLREQHKINAISEPLLDGKEIVYQFKVYSFSIKKRKNFGDFYYKTYEDCLEAALLQALNLIK
jgi:hypothetical protein